MSDQLNKDRVPINLHGGGFSGCAELESRPITALAGINVVSVDDSQGPENKFPAPPGLFFFYSILNAFIGSVDAARRAGTIAAAAAVARSSTTLPPMASGSITGV